MKIKRLKTQAASGEIAAYKEQVRLLKNCPIPDSEILANIALFMNRSSLSQLLFVEHLYRQILPIHGIILELGVRWGRNLATMITLRNVLEPYNFSRKIVGFDSFAGFPSVSVKDGSDPTISKKALTVTKRYDRYLSSLLGSHERLGLRGHLKRFELCKGDATVTVPEYLKEHPESVIALAYFDFDLYKPTRICLEAIAPFLTKGSIIAFDEACHASFPGETIALREADILSRCCLQRLPFNGFQSFVAIK